MVRNNHERCVWLRRSASLIAISLGLTNCAPASEPTPTSALPEFVGDTMPTSLTGQAGSSERGHSIFQDRESGHCVLCHQIQGLSAEFQGDVGPDLTYVGERLSPEQIRLRIVDYASLLPGATMPSYFRTHDLHQVGREFENQTVLTANEVEDLVAFLSEQKETQ